MDCGVFITILNDGAPDWTGSIITAGGAFGVPDSTGSITTGGYDKIGGFFGSFSLNCEINRGVGSGLSFNPKRISDKNGFLIV